MKIFFATDLHGCELCFKKFLKAATFYAADILLLGGDYGPKESVLFADTNGVVRTFDSSGEHREFAHEHFERYRQWCRTSGILLKSVDAPDLEQVTPESYRAFSDRALDEMLSGWARLAQDAFRRDRVPIYVIPGNDDPPETDKYFAELPYIFLHRRVAALSDEITLMGWGGSNATPWRTPREYSEEQIASELEQTYELAPKHTATVLLAHPPPFRCGLDLAPEITNKFSYQLSFGSSRMTPVGSVAVREFIERRQPLAGLFGHVHESRGAQKIGETLCVNPGSAFYAGRLLGCLLTILDRRILDVQFTDG